MKKFTSISLILYILFVPFSLFGQAAPPATPIDGGLSLLLIAGGIFGAKKIYDKRGSN